MIRRLVFGLILLTGAGLFGSGIWMSAKAGIAQFLMDRAWAEAQLHQISAPPWPGMDAKPLAHLSAPAFKQEAIILDQASGQALAFGPAFMTGTAPLGTPGLSAIAAHKNTHFSFLEKLTLQDEIKIETLTGDVLTYKVIGTDILNTDTQDFVVPETAQSSKLALITCYPFDAVSFGGPLRYIVYAELKA